MLSSRGVVRNFSRGNFQIFCMKTKNFFEFFSFSRKSRKLKNFLVRGGSLLATRLLSSYQQPTNYFLPFISPHFTQQMEQNIHFHSFYSNPTAVNKKKLLIHVLEWK